MIEQEHRFVAGDVISLGGPNSGEPARLGEIVEVLGEPGDERYRVGWEDGRQTILYPGHEARLHVRRTPVDHDLCGSGRRSPRPPRPGE